MLQPGSRVGVILSTNEETQVVKFFGYGTYTEDSADNPLGINIPKLTLDSGDVVWGYECWWGAESKIQNKMAEYIAEGFTIEMINVANFHAGMK